jgi:large subunit ribosomal protein L24
MNIRKGDTVVVLSGSDIGKSGRVIAVYPKKGTVIVERVRLAKRHTKPGRKQNMQGGIVERELPIRACKVGLMDPKTHKATRVRREFAADGAAVRVAVRSGNVIEKA